MGRRARTCAKSNGGVLMATLLYIVFQCLKIILSRAGRGMFIAVYRDTPHLVCVIINVPCAQFVFVQVCIRRRVHICVCACARCCADRARQQPAYMHIYPIECSCTKCVCPIMRPSGSAVSRSDRWGVSPANTAVAAPSNAFGTGPQNSQRNRAPALRRSEWLGEGRCLGRRRRSQ